MRSACFVRPSLQNSVQNPVSFLSNTMFNQDLGAAWLVSRGWLAKWKH